MEGRDGNRPLDAFRIMILLNRSRSGSAHADSVTAHDRQLFLSLRIQEGGLHRLAVLCPQHKDMADFDALGRLQGAVFAG